MRIHPVHIGLAERVSVDQSIEAEVVAQGDIEIGLVLAHIVHGEPVQIRIVHLAVTLRMRVALKRECERAALRTLGMEAVLASFEVIREN